ncbi:MAG: 2-oxoglutarate dehydrogenase E1 component [Parachlamydiaceae bacterium]
MPEDSILNIAISNPELFENIYHKYLNDRSSVASDWQKIFSDWVVECQYPTKNFNHQKPDKSIDASSKKLKISRLIDAYRSFGYLAADINPLDNNRREPWQLNLEVLGFKEEELSQYFPSCGLFEEDEKPLIEIIGALKETYCQHMGVEYIGFHSPELESWLQSRIEFSRFKAQLSIEQKQEILQQLSKSELLETFLHTKYIGQKRFSIEGGETLIPMLAFLIDSGAEKGVSEFYLGMAHRGRLNVLANIINKAYANIFTEFDENYIPQSFEGSGDVKYHKGFFSNVKTIRGHAVSIQLVPNPSHLESVGPVVEGEVLARQIKLNDRDKTQVLPILIHGDAALSGQGIVYETLQLSKLPNYSTGGTIHIVVNNQIGFTTLPKEARSTAYCTDIAKAFGAPVFHVNAEHPEDCVHVILLAIEMRQKFHCDVFIDLNCYRKYGHNEGDEPFFTQPVDYKKIRSKKPIRELYKEQLISQGILEQFVAESIESEFKKALHQALKSAKLPGVANTEEELQPTLEKFPREVSTGVKYQVLRKVAEQLCSIPNGFNIHPKLERLYQERLNMIVPRNHARPIDWGMAELLAYGTLNAEGVPIRLVGQDSGRGTFSHRHALLVDQSNAHYFFPLNQVSDKAKSTIVNSPLSEFAALAFEYGYSIAYPEALVIWEAQFGDFANGGQVVIDQYISSAEQKWGQKSGLILFLPHGYEGQGPEHSSGRLERFLALAGNDNLIITYPTTPAQMFHVIRRQQIGLLQKPLIVMTPKGLLRLPECVSTIEDLEKGAFKEIIDDDEDYRKAKKLVFCTGRIYYDLKEERAKRDREDIALIRIEQLYPLNSELLNNLLLQYSMAKEWVWAQEEPENMGAWSYIGELIKEADVKKRDFQYIGRARSASPATGSYYTHKQEHQKIINRIFDNKTSKLDIPQQFRV